MSQSSDDPLGIVGEILIDKIEKQAGIIKYYNMDHHYYLIRFPNRDYLYSPEYITNTIGIEIRDHPDPDHLQIPKE